MHSITLIEPRLGLFDGEAAAGTPDAGNDGGQTQSAPEGADAQTAPEGPDAEARRRAYREARREYRDLYEQDVQRLIDRRFRETKELREKLESCRPVLEAVAKRCGADPGDVRSIAFALEDEDARREASASARLAQWTREGEALRSRYPGFDLAKEAKDPRFTAMLRAELPMELAYRAVHAEEILSGAIRQAASLTERRVVENIRAKGQRPAEAGLGAQTGVVVKNDVSRLTKEERAEFARRALRGENISF